MKQRTHQDGAGLEPKQISLGDFLYNLRGFIEFCLFSYEIVYQFGGIYLDLDSQSVKPFGSYFLKSFVCYDVGWNTLVHSVFGMPPGSKFLRFALESARMNNRNEEFRKRIVYLRFGPSFLGKMFFEFNDDRINIIDSGYLIWNHTNSNYMIQVRQALSIC